MNSWSRYEIKGSGAEGPCVMELNLWVTVRRMMNCVCVTYNSSNALLWLARMFREGGGCDNPIVIHAYSLSLHGDLYSHAEFRTPIQWRWILWSLWTSSAWSLVWNVQMFLDASYSVLRKKNLFCKTGHCEPFLWGSEVRKEEGGYSVDEWGAGVTAAVWQTAESARLDLSVCGLLAAWEMNAGHSPNAQFYVWLVSCSSSSRYGR